MDPQDTSISKPIFFIEREHRLTPDHCNTTFFNSLRCDTDNTKGHVETKIAFVPIKVNLKKNINISHIFTGEDPRTIRTSSIKRFYTPSKIVFNSYHKENLKKNYPKIKKYEIENRIRIQNEKCSSTKNSSILYKKIKDNYLHNPVRTYNKDEIKKYNDEFNKKYQKHSSAYGTYYNSKNLRRSMGGGKNYYDRLRIVDTSKEMDKIVNNSININRTSVAINRNKNKEIPYYGRRKIRKNFINNNDKNVNLSYCNKRD